MAFERAIVEEVMNDLSLYTEEKIRETANRVTNRRAFCDEDLEHNVLYTDDPLKADDKYYLRAPRGSILARPASESAGTDRHEEASVAVYYPFFASHFCLPIKPGEYVWTFTEGETSYWVTRVCEPNNVEDPNFTHGDRVLPVVIPPVKFDAVELKADPDAALVPRTPMFPNGKDFNNRESALQITQEMLDVYDAQAGDPSLKGQFDYDIIYSDNLEKNRIVYEPVPRLTKRPGDLVLQGSNNTAIILGTERGYTAKPPATVDTAGIPLSPKIAAARPSGTQTNADPDFDGKATVADVHDTLLPHSLDVRMGSIDIVVGRGRIQETGTAADPKATDYLAPAEAPDVAVAPAADTARPRVIKNARGHLELDKNVGIDPGETKLAHELDVSEGDPDMLHDASRVYVAMKSSPDDLMGLVYPMAPAVADLLNVAAAVPPVYDSASIIVKSDEVRIIARQDADPVGLSGHAINGSIKIVKEGIADDEAGFGRAVIMLLPDGTIMIDGPKVVIGSGIVKENGEGNQVALGNGAIEPIVLGTQLQGILSAIINVLDNHIHPTGTGPSGKRVAGGSEPFGGTNFTNTTADITDLKLMLSKLGKTL